MSPAPEAKTKRISSTDPHVPARRRLGYGEGTEQFADYYRGKAIAEYTQEELAALKEGLKRKRNGSR